MTVSADISGTLGSVQWSDEQLYLREFIHKHGLPAVVRIVKGQYCNLGVSSLSNPGLQSTILLTNLGKVKRLLGQSIKFKDNNKRVVPVGPKLAIPNTYEGFFELLSEDGRSVRCIESVSELIRRFPDAVLVREAVRAFVSKSDNVDTIEDQCRQVQVGETLLLVGEVRPSTTNMTPTSTNKRFLRCFDKNGENVYLPHDLKGKFSAIAKEDNISGVHTVENLSNKRLPVMTRLVHGLPPVGLKSSQTFQPEIRLFSVIDEDFLVAMTLSSNTTAVLPLPLPSNLKLQYASNMTYLSTTKEFMRLKERCESLSQHFEDRIMVHDIAIPKDLRINGADLKQKIIINKPVMHQQPMPNAAFMTRKFNDDYDEIEQIYDYVRGFAPLPKTARGWRYEPTQSSPTKNTIASPARSTEDESANSSDMTPPEPPPIETLPSRLKQSDLIFSPPPWGMAVVQTISHPPTVQAKPEAKKRQRHSASSAEKSTPNSSGAGGAQQNNSSLSSTAAPSTTANRFVKSANYKSIQGGNSTVNYRQRLFRSNRSSKADLFSNSAQASTAPNSSSMFQMRYKSMTNLAQVVQQHHHASGNEYDTLNSSNSGGKTSGSSTRHQQPEKRSRKLSRPKSLTNLVWGSTRDRSASRQSLNGPDMDPMRRLEPGVFGGLGNRRLDYHGHHHGHPASAGVFANGKKLGSSKKIGTLYL